MHATYSQILDENSVDLLSAPLDEFDCEMPEAGAEEEEDDGDEDVEEIGEDVFNESQVPVTRKRSGNNTELEDTILIKAWESVSLNAGVGNDQSRARYWQHMEDKYHKLMPTSSL